MARRPGISRASAYSPVFSKFFWSISSVPPAL